MRRALPWVPAALGAALVAAGIVVFWLANTLPAGWAAYSPLSPGDPAPYTSSLTVSVQGGSVLWTGRHLLGAGLVVLGSLVLVALGGWVLGRRAGRKTLLSGD